MGPLLFVDIIPKVARIWYPVVNKMASLVAITFSANACWNAMSMVGTKRHLIRWDAARTRVI